MKTKNFLKMSIFCIFAISVILPWSRVFAATINVPGDQATIQAGIDAASDGDTVLVADGTYVETIKFNGKAISLVSANGPDTAIIDGNNDWPTVSFENHEGNSSIIEGFTIKGGRGTGIMLQAWASPKIINCHVKNNFGDGIYGSHNQGGLEIMNCEILNNDGCGMYFFNSSPTIDGCRIHANFGSYGVSFYNSPGTIKNCLISENVVGIRFRADLNGWGFSPNIVNSTITGNTKSLTFTSGEEPSLTNCILFGNQESTIRLDGLYTMVTVTHCLIEGGESSFDTSAGGRVTWGSGNISGTPLFVDATNNDYHLQTGSPCIDLGTSEGAPSTDIDGTPRPQGAGYDMGAYERSGATIHIPSDYSTIQTGIDAASNGDTVLVADGTYTGVGNKNLDFKGKAITVKSENGARSCVIDCEGDGQGFYFHNEEGPGSLLSGFTITNGNAVYGGGIACWYSSSPTIADCIVTANMATNGGGGIVCLASSSPTITRCISGNTGGSWGGGIHCEGSSSPTITNCLIFENEVLGLGNGGGGISCYPSCSPVIMNSNSHSIHRRLSRANFSRNSFL